MKYLDESASLVHQNRKIKNGNINVATSSINPVYPLI